MADRIVAPYGSWESPFAIERLTDGVVFLGEVRRHRGTWWWLEGRPEEAGRQMLVRRESEGTITRMTPEGFNVRCRVHEYGGAATLVSGDLVIASDFATGRLNRVVAPGEVVPLTPDGAWRFADMVHDVERGRLYAVREDHDPTVVAGHGEWVNELVAIDVASGEIGVIAKGADFYLHNRLFHAKLGLFILLLMLEIRPMVTLIRWRIARAKGASPDTSSARALYRLNHIELGVVVVMVFVAAFMARGFGAR